MFLSTLICLSVLLFFYDSVGICAWSVRPELHRIVIHPEINQLSSEHRVLPRRHFLERLAALTGSIFVSPVAGYAVEDAIEEQAFIDESSDSSDSNSADLSGGDANANATSNGGFAANDDDSFSNDGETSEDTSDSNSADLSGGDADANADAASNGGFAANDDDSFSNDGEMNEDTSDDEF